MSRSIGRRVATPAESIGPVDRVDDVKPPLRAVGLAVVCGKEDELRVGAAAVEGRRVAELIERPSATWAPEAEVCGALHGWRGAVAGRPLVSAGVRGGEGRWVEGHCDVVWPRRSIPQGVLDRFRILGGFGSHAPGTPRWLVGSRGGQVAFVKVEMPAVARAGAPAESILSHPPLAVPTALERWR